MEEEDIKILETILIQSKMNIYNEKFMIIYEHHLKALENLLKVYKQNEKMIDLMAEDMIMTRPMTTEEYRNSSHSEYSNGRIIMSNKEIKEYFRKRCLDEKKSNEEMDT